MDMMRALGALFVPAPPGASPRPRSGAATPMPGETTPGPNHLPATARPPPSASAGFSCDRSGDSASSPSLLLFATTGFIARSIRGLLRLTGTPPDAEFTEGNHGRAGLAADRLHLGEVSRAPTTMVRLSAALNRALPRGPALLLPAHAGSPGVRQHHGAAGPRTGSRRRGTRRPLTPPVRTVHARADPFSDHAETRDPQAYWCPRHSKTKSERHL